MSSSHVALPAVAQRPAETLGNRSMPDETALQPLDLTGIWRVTHHVETSRRASLVGLRIEFKMTFVQDGNQLAGEGEKFLVDHQPAKWEEASRLAITGWVHGRDVRISLLEIAPQNGQRAIVGEIAWIAEAPHRLAGSFRVDLAATSGRSEAERLPG
jgi:hypothetical protein